MDYKLTVTEFVNTVNFTLDTLEGVTVEGEVGEFKIIHNKWVTFSLKDEESTVNCFMPVWEFKAQVEDGMLVRATGKPRLRNKGFFSFVLSNVQPSGEGALKRAFLLLQQKLAAEGLFDPGRKRPLPRWPEHIALITSKDAAAYSDFLKVLQARQGGLTVSFIHTQVQGADAPKQLVEALNTANTELKDLDAIVMIRGGGSLEDLQAFNDERVVRAVAASRAPTIVGIGHERDVTLAELAADVRASTPSNAAELLVISRQEALLEIERLRDCLKSSIAAELQRQQEEISYAARELKARIISTAQEVTRQIDRLQGNGRRFSQTAAQKRQDISMKKRSLIKTMSSSLLYTQNQLESIQRILTGISPQETLKRGYTITRLKNGSILKQTSQIKPGETLATQLSDGEILSEAIEIRNI